MPKRKALVSNPDDYQPMRPALTPEARENQMISLAMDLVEQRLRDRTASSQETTHFLKLAATQESRALEIEKLKTENKLLQAKIENLQAQSSSSSLYEKALKAFSIYSGQGKINDDDEET